MNIKEVQTRLKTAGFYKGNADGIYTPQTDGAINLLLASQKVGNTYSWDAKRKLIAAGQAFCKIDGIDAGKIDGQMGPQTRYGFEVYAARKLGPAEEKQVTTWRDTAPVKPPLYTPVASKNHWPLQRDMANFFGAPGTNHFTLELPYPMKLAWDLNTTVNRMTVNVKIKDAVHTIFKQTLDHYGMEQIRELRLDRFGGCFNNRKMRGGSALSTHAYAAAIDIDPDNNQLKWNHLRATLDGASYQAFWGFVEGQGGVSLGRLKDYDWMHFQFARLS